MKRLHTLQKQTKQQLDRMKARISQSVEESGDRGESLTIMLAHLTALVATFSNEKGTLFVANSGSIHGCYHSTWYHVILILFSNNNN